MAGPPLSGPEDRFRQWTTSTCLPKARLADKKLNDSLEQVIVTSATANRLQNLLSRLFSRTFYTLLASLSNPFFLLLHVSPSLLPYINPILPSFLQTHNYLKSSLQISCASFESFKITSASFESFKITSASFESLISLLLLFNMASSIALRRFAGSSLVNKLLHSGRSPVLAPATIRSFNNNAQLRNYDEDERDMEVDTDRRYRSVSRCSDSSPSLFSDVFDPFNPTRSLSQVLNVMDQFMENPFLNASRGIGAGLRRGWDAREDADGLYLRVDMPGLAKENVKVSVEENTLTIEGEGEKESDEESSRRFSSRIDLPPKLYKLDQIKAEMKNGVLKVMVPKVKEEDKKDVFQINVE